VTNTDAPTHADLLARMKEIEPELEKLAAHDKLTRAQDTQFQGLRDEYEDLDLARKRLERQVDLDKIRSLAQGANGGRTFEGSTGADEPTRHSGGEIRDQAARVIDAAFRSGSLPDHAAEKATALLSRGMPLERSLAARWAATTGDPAYSSAFTKLLADPTRGHLLWDAREQAAYQAVAAVQGEMRAMSLTDSAGGYMVPLTLDPSIILTSAGSNNPLRQISRTVQTVTDQWQGVSSAGVTAEWIAEAAEVADASPTLGDEPISVHKGDAFVPFSFEVGMDAVNFLAELQNLLLDAADQLQATAFTTGTGSGQPKGIITALAGTASEINVITAETFTAADVYALQEALPPRFQGNARWTANVAVLNDIAAFETANGSKVFPEVSANPPMLLRKPLHENSNMDGSWSITATANNYILVIGDFSTGYVIVDRIGTTLELVPHMFHTTTNRPSGQRGALLWFRTGADAVNINAFRMLDLPTTA
jgi:HK97 family phage major capsid protein